jgi:ankyrin repeat protein
MVALSQEQITEFVQAAHHNLPVVQSMLAEQPELLDARQAQFNETAIEAAAHIGRQDIAEYLLEQGAPLGICTAAMLGRLETVRHLLQKDPAQAQAFGAHGRISAFYHAAISGDTEITALLLENGATVDDQALHAAVRHDHIDMVKWLLENGIGDINVHNFNDQTPLQAAIENGHEAIATVLRGHGAE